MSGRRNAINVERSIWFLSRKAQLDEPPRTALELAEEAVIVDPHHWSKLFLRPDGTIADLNQQDILIAFRVEGDSLVFVDFVDLTSAR